VVEDLATSAGCILEAIRSRLPWRPGAGGADRIQDQIEPACRPPVPDWLVLRPPALLSIRSIPSVTQFDEHSLVFGARLPSPSPELQEALHPEEVFHVIAGVRADAFSSSPCLPITMAFWDSFSTYTVALIRASRPSRLHLPPRRAPKDRRLFFPR